MKLEEKFFKSFFFIFLIGVILSSFVVTLFLGLFTNDNYDKKTSQNIINSRKKNSETIIKSINLLLTTKFLKIQASLNEIILYYQRIAKKLLKSNKNYEINNDLLKCLLKIDNFCSNIPEGTERMALWLLDEMTTEEDLDDKNEVKLQLISYGNILKNMYSILEANKPDTHYYHFYSNVTELFISYPLKQSCDNYDIYYFKYTGYSDTSCIDDDGYNYITYKVKCQNFFINMMKSRTDAFDNNYLSNQNKTIYITNSYGFVDFESYGIEVIRDFTMCIEFEDPITKGSAYVCTIVTCNELIDSLEYFNTKIDGYFFITLVGFNPVFYFPKGTISPKTATENIYKWENHYKLEEKDYFHEHVKKIMSSNYLDYISDSNYQEIYVDGKNGSNQFFYVNEEKMKYSIYPI